MSNPAVPDPFETGGPLATTPDPMGNRTTCLYPGDTVFVGGRAYVVDDNSNLREGHQALDGFSDADENAEFYYGNGLKLKDMSEEHIQGAIQNHKKSVEALRKLSDFYHIKRTQAEDDAEYRQDLIDRLRLELRRRKGRDKA